MINFKSPLSTDIGYGVVAYGILRNLIQIHNQEICYFPIGNPSIHQQDAQIIQQAVNNQDKFDSDATALTVWHEHSIHERIGRGKNVAISFFELDTLNERRIRNISNHDIFIASSKWMENIVKTFIPNQPVKIIPMGVDSDYFKPMFLQFPSEKPFIFLNVAKLEIRKGHDILYDIFNKAFTQEDHVQLNIMWDSPFVSVDERKKWEDMYKSSPLGNKIHFIQRLPDVRQEYAIADCFIFPTRAESICLPALEAMACNKPVIITNYSGQTEFCNKDNAYLVEIEDLETAYDGIWFHGDGNWAKLGENQIDQFVEHMRFCYQNRMNINPAGRETALRLDWKNVSKQVLDILI